jgi:hypothetical protein
MNVFIEGEEPLRPVTAKALQLSGLAMELEIGVSLFFVVKHPLRDELKAVEVRAEVTGDGAIEVRLSVVEEEE